MLLLPLLLLLLSLWVLLQGFCEEEDGFQQFLLCVTHLPREPAPSSSPPVKLLEPPPTF